MSFVNWMFDKLASEDVLDLYFVLSDMIEINLTEAEKCEQAYFDSMATQTTRINQGENKVPIGKQVL
ncbi:MAG: hypothetical protein ACYTFW_05140 [Planctomycetota bacterium]|jgi:hypothetical protein